MMTPISKRPIRAALPMLSVFLAAVGATAAETPAQRDRKPLFTPEEVRAYVPKGPSLRYRYFCSAYQNVFGPLDSYLSKADPVEYAEFHVKLHADAALILAVPHEGYCVYPSEIGPVYPSCVNRDFLGLTIRELHKRDIAAFAYVTLGWNARYAREHPEFDDGGTLCFCSPYMDLIIAYSQEILRKYPVDGLRWDILGQSGRCRCDGCKKLYRNMFGEELPKDWNAVGWKRRELFKQEKVAQAVRRLHEACKAVKPSVEIWHNQLNIDSDNPLSAMKYVDMAYIEWADPWGLLFHNSATPKNGFIVGKLENLGFRTMRLCLALGGHGYTYIMARHDTALPPVSEEEADQWRRQRGWTGGTARENARSRAETIDKLAPFYEMLSKAQPYYEGGRPVYHGVGVVFCDATRYKYPNFSRGRYRELLKALGNAYLKQSLALEYLSSYMLPEGDLSRYRVLVLPETSGLKPKELDALRTYVRAGGKLLIVGDALRHDEQGEPMRDFALAEEMGIRFSEIDVDFDAGGRLSGRNENAAEIRVAKGSPVRPPLAISIKQAVTTTPTAGTTLIEMRRGGKSCPLLHVNALGRGQLYYLASSDSPGLLQETIDSLAGARPVAVAPADKQVILTRQEKRNRWILHFMDAGNCTVDINRDFAAPTKIIGQYPAEGWAAKLEKTDAGTRITVGGDAGNRLLVLQ
jgi:hypothetical protein